MVLRHIHTIYDYGATVVHEPAIIELGTPVMEVLFGIA